MSRYVVRAYKGYRIVCSIQRLETLVEANAAMDRLHATLGRNECDRIQIEESGYPITTIRDR